jgi:SAM-dependent methyltransferase
MNRYDIKRSTNNIKRYFKYLKDRKIRLFSLLYIIYYIKYNIKYRAMGINLKTQEKNISGMFAQQDSGGPELDMIFSTINILPTDNVIDIGCGKGGALISLSKYPFKRVDGIEIFKDVCEIAEKNISKTTNKKINIYCEDARNFDKYSVYNVFYVYNPFSGVIMKIVLEKIFKSIAKNPRNIIFIYLNPVYHDVVVQSGIFIKCIDPNIFSLNVKIYSNNREFKLK